MVSVRTCSEGCCSSQVRKSDAIESNAACEYSTRSILLTATIMCRTPSKPTIVACRSVWATIPLRASTSSTAASAAEAAVTMLRVYWTCPGLSAMMNLRRAVAK